MSVPNTATRTYFQQKWTAKASTRAYHGEVVPEKQWQRMFTRRAHAVVPMNPQYLAENDGSEHAAGRGSGLEKDPRERPDRLPLRTPYTQMVYHPLERRLDTAIFRALFACSTRMARQFVVHGHVKVNGKVVCCGYSDLLAPMLTIAASPTWIPAQSRRYVPSCSRKGSHQYWSVEKSKTRKGL
jgi:ribosomal protein S4